MRSRKVGAVLSVQRRMVSGVTDYERAVLLRDALGNMGLADPLLEQFKAMEPVLAIPLMKTLIEDAGHEGIARLNAAHYSVLRQTTANGVAYLEVGAF